MKLFHRRYDIKIVVKNILVMFFLFQIISACTNNLSIRDINGIWGRYFIVFEIKNSTLTLYPSEKKYSIEVIDNEIILVDRIDTINNNYNDTLKYPYKFGVVEKKSNENIITSSMFYREKSFSKLSVNKDNSQLLKFQFTSGYWSSGFNFEVDSSGNSFIAEEGFCDNKSSYSFKLFKEEMSSIFILASQVKYDSLNPQYVCKGCADFPRYTFSFFFEDDTVSTFIYGETEHFSLIPLRIYLEGKTFEYSRDTSNSNKVKDKFFFSRLTECQNDTASIIMYYREFDTINYQLPVYDKITMKKIFDKYYNFEDDNICYDINTDSLGQIVYFDFYNPEIISNQIFLTEIKEKVSVKPAIFNGKKIALKDFECINYINIENKE